MRKMKLGAALMVLMLGGVFGQAQARECHEESSGCCFDFDVGVDFLYWKPCVDDLDFAAKVSGNIEDVDRPLLVSYKSICPDWEPGFRITLSRENAWKCFGLSLAYTWFESGDSGSARADNGERIAPTLVPPTFVNLKNVGFPNENSFFDSGRGKWEMEYQTFDILLSYQLAFGSCHTLTPFFGVQVVKLDQEIKGKYEDTLVGTFEEGPLSDLSVTTIDSKWKSDYTGAGLKLGTSYTYALCGDFKLFASAAASLVIGDSDTSSQFSFRQTTFEESTREDYMHVKDDDCCHILPGCHLQLGLAYDGNSCGCDWTFKLGYEFVAWTNVPTYRRFQESADVLQPGGLMSPRQISGSEAQIAQSNLVNNGTIGFHGLTVGLNVGF
ncbi:Lpg1974 family pore-forming outer membrane protein [Estrella lausannensis]|uniref:Outer membrane protein n=1 Tax=Estrella lausannensis TaxID=483423 RepID=A0A0H5DQ61_9BACT|nr:Lpg1974 family pore-forming outer membrane protein [Estrella lausannensis]CRX38627.1 Outer membrane protein [Estrella lausannensis]